MVICKKCGVELEAGMDACPLCGQLINGLNEEGHELPAYSQQLPPHKQMTIPQKKFTWEIISLILLSAIAATFVIDFIINKAITWSEYPAAIILVIFSYVSLLTLWQQRTIIQLMAGLVLSSLCMVIVDATTGGIDWTLSLGIPILLGVNIVIAALVSIIQVSKYKGVNLLAWAFAGAAVLCVCVDGILSYYQTKSIRLNWSIIAGGCIIPIVLVLIFVHFRLKKGRNLKRTFHV